MTETKHRRRWFDTPDNASETYRERIEVVNDALADGKAVTLAVGYKHESRWTVFYHDGERDALLYSPFVDGRRRVIGYSPDRIGGTALKSMTLGICFADERRVSDVEETRLAGRSVESIE